MVLMSDIAIILSSLLFWRCVDMVKLFKNEKIFNSALIHASVSATYSIYACILYPEITFGDTPEFWNRLPLISYGYGMYDLAWAIQNRKMDEISHGLIFVSSCSIAYYGNILHVMYCGLIIETSTIFLNLRPLQYVWNDVLFVITFFIFRLGVSPYLFITYALTQPVSIEMKYIILCGAICISLLNLYWFYLISRMIYKKHLHNYLTN